ncbi:uncharacterized protein [Antedon mediterranea]|uniref:uncharacterized protein n=1 Tax=Antedon mediterranea TaxID=105859 RepID=UPI003AF4D4D7
MANLKNEFDYLKFELSKYYTGERYSWLKFCLFDNLSLSDLTDKESTGHTLFNELERIHVVTANDVNLLLEITALTGSDDARKRVNQYIEDNNIQNTDKHKLTTYRKQLFRAVREAEPVALNKVTAMYKLTHLNFTNLWDVIFHLETNGILPTEIDKFGSLLGKRAEKELLSTDKKTKRVREANISSGSNIDDDEISDQTCQKKRKITEDSYSDDDMNAQASTSAHTGHKLKRRLKYKSDKENVDEDRAPKSKKIVSREGH